MSREITKDVNKQAAYAYQKIKASNMPYDKNTDITKAEPYWNQLTS
jgi:hypothetical protein